MIEIQNQLSLTAGSNNEDVAGMVSCKFLGVTLLLVTIRDGRTAKRGKIGLLKDSV